VEGDVPDRRRDRDHDNKISPSRMKRVHGNDRNRVASRRLMAPDRILISEPDLSSCGKWA
jgi:hypothetical protein